MDTTKGIKLAFLTALISGIAIFINKFAVDAITPPLVFTAVKNTGVAMLIISLLISLRKFKAFANLNRHQIFNLLIIGLIGGAIPFYLFFTGLSLIPAINAALIHKSMVIWVAILAWPLLKEKLSPLQILAIIMLFASNLVIGGFLGFTWSTGELMVLAATILWAIENIIAKHLLNGKNHRLKYGNVPVYPNKRETGEAYEKGEQGLDPDLLAAARMGIGSLILLSTALWQYPQTLGQITALTSTQWLWIMATTATLLVYVMTWYRALKFATVTTVATILVSSTVVTNLLSAIFITRVWSTDMLIQAGIMVFGLGVFIWGARKNFPLQNQNPETRHGIVLR